MRFKKPITRDIFFQVLDKVGLPLRMDEFLRDGRNIDGKELHGASVDVYRNRVGGYLRSIGAGPSARTAFMDTLRARIFNDPALFGRVFVYTDAQDLFAVLLLAAGAPPKSADSSMWKYYEELRDTHTKVVKDQLRALRAPTCTLTAEQFESCVEFKAEQFNLWCKSGGTFGVHSDTKEPLED